MPNRYDQNRSSTWHIVVQLSKVQHSDNSQKSAEEMPGQFYNNYDKTNMVFSAEILQIGREWKAMPIRIHLPNEIIMDKWRENKDSPKSTQNWFCYYFFSRTTGN